MRPVVGVFGGAWIGTTDGQPQTARSGIQSALLAMLILHCRDAPLSFDALAEVLWPGQPSDKIRNSLRVQTSSLRKALEKTAGPESPLAIETKYGGYLLSVPPNGTDVEQFETGVRQARTQIASGNTASAEVALTAALELWDGPYRELVGHLDADAERHRLSELYELATDDLFDTRLRRGASRELVSDLEARVVLNPHRERGYGQLMTALYLAGRQADSLAVFQRARTTLTNDLGVEPSPSLREVEAAVLAQTLTSPIVHTRSHETPRNKTPFIGRAPELAALRDHVSSSPFVLVAGEPGIGKTRLIEEFADGSSPELRVLVSTAPKDLSAPPLWPILSILAQPTTSWVVDDAAEFRRNQTLLHELAATLSVVVIDDFQWADEATLRFIRQASFDPMRGDTVFVLAYRNAAVDLETSAGALVTELTTRAGVTEIVLSVFDQPDIEYLAQLTAPSEYSPAQLAQLVARSGGNPLFINELIRTGPSSDRLPSAVGQVVVSRLADLSDQSTDVLTTAAVVGDTVEMDLLLAVCAAPVIDVLRGLEDGRRAGLLTTDDDIRYRFPHAVIREALADHKATVKVRQIHEAVARTLEERVADSPELVIRIARHVWNALPLGSVDRAVTSLRTAAELSADSLAFGDASAFLKQAEVAANQLDSPSRQAQMPWLLCELGYAQMRGGDSAAGRDNLKRAVNASRTAENAEAFTHAVRCLLEGRSPVAPQEPGLVDLVEEALVVSKGAVSEDRVQLLADLAGLRYFTHDRSHREELAQVAIDMADDLGEPKPRAIALLARCTALNLPSTVNDRLEWAAAGQQLASEAGSTDFVTLGVATEIAAAVEAGQHDRARRVLVNGKQHLVGLQIPRFDWFLSGWDVLFEIMAGNLTEAESLATEALMAWEGGTHADGLAAFGGQLSIIRLLQGQAKELIDLLSDFFAQDPDNVLIGSLLTFAKAASSEADAGDLVDRLLARIGRDGLREDALTLPTLAFVVESAVLVEADPLRVAKIIDVIAPWRSHHVVVNVFGTGGIYWGSMQHTLGLAHGLAQNLTSARSWLESAEAEHQRVGAEQFAKRSRDALAQLD